jgi:hypothetical protein
MLKNLLNFKKTKTLPEAAVFYGVMVAAVWVFATALEMLVQSGRL